MATLRPIAVGPERSKGSVIFVHGLGGDAFGTWGDAHSRSKRFWPGWLARDPELSGLSLYTLSYQADPIALRGGKAMHLDDYGEAVLPELLKEKQLLRAPIAFVCHSLGGLVVKQLMLRAVEEGTEDAEALVSNTRQVVFIATPHRGSRVPVLVQRWASILAPTVILGELATGSHTLFVLSKRYKRLCQRRHVRHLVFGETQRTRGVTVVAQDDAQLGFEEHYIPIEADHIEIAKPKDDSSQLYREIRDWLRTLPFRSHVFISATPGDDDVAHEIYGLLEDKGLSVTLGQQPSRRKRELAEAHHVIVLWSESSCKSALVQGEAVAADDAGKLLSYRIDDCDVPERFAKRTRRVDDFQTFLPQLLRDLGVTEAARSSAASEAQSDFEQQLRKLPGTSGDFIGRASELRMLLDAWRSGRTRVVALEAFGGQGKTALLRRFLTDIHDRADSDVPFVYCWSAYRQGSHENGRQHANELLYGTQELKGAFAWLGADAELEALQSKGENERAVGRRLGELIGKRRMLLVLDGLEPLQDPPKVNEGRLRDAALAALIEALTENGRSMVIVTSRQRVEEIEDGREPRLVRCKLPELDVESGVKLLKSRDVTGDHETMVEAVEAAGCHALTLHLLGTWLDSDSRAQGDVSHWRDALADMARFESPEGRLRVVLDAYVKRLKDEALTKQGSLEIKWLSIVGLFDSAADGAAIDALLDTKEPPIEGLTDGFLGPKGGRRDRYALARLRELGLLLPRDDANRRTVDAHPLVRAYFRQELVRTDKEAFREASRRLYRHFESLSGRRLPNGLGEMQPLLQAVAFGCNAGLHQDVYSRIWQRLLDRGEFYIGHVLGGYTAAIGAISRFFEEAANGDWSMPKGRLRPVDEANLLFSAGTALMATGRLREAIEPYRLAFERMAELEQWAKAATAATCLSDVRLRLGDTLGAQADAQSAVECARKGGFSYERIAAATTLAHALHEMGGLRSLDAQRVFRNAERRQARQSPDKPLLSSTGGFRYCELLLDMGEHDAVMERARQWLRDLGAPAPSLHPRAVKVAEDADVDSQTSPWAGRCTSRAKIWTKLSTT